MVVSHTVLWEKKVRQGAQPAWWCTPTLGKLRKEDSFQGMHLGGRYGVSTRWIRVIRSQDWIPRTPIKSLTCNCHAQEVEIRDACTTWLCKQYGKLWSKTPNDVSLKSSYAAYWKIQVLIHSQTHIHYIYTHLTAHMIERANKREARKGELQELELIVKHQNGFKGTTSTQSRLCIVYKELAQLRTECIFSDRRCLYLNSSPTPQRRATGGEHWSLCEKQWLHRVTGG